MPLQATESTENPPTNVDVSNLATHGLLAAVTAAVVNGVVLAVALDAFGVPAGFPLSWGPVLASSVIPAVGATLVYGVIARASRRPNRVFTAAAALVLALSFAPFASPPPELAGAPLSVFVTLGVMHVTAAVVIVGLLTRVPRTDGSAEGSR